LVVCILATFLPTYSNVDDSFNIPTYLIVYILNESFNTFILKKKEFKQLSH
jgi:hypothetical protein